MEKERSSVFPWSFVLHNRHIVVSSDIYACSLCVLLLFLFHSEACTFSTMKLVIISFFSVLQFLLVLLLSLLLRILFAAVSVCRTEKTFRLRLLRFNVCCRIQNEYNRRYKTQTTGRRIKKYSATAGVDVLLLVKIVFFVHETIYDIY